MTSALETAATPATSNEGTLVLRRTLPATPEQVFAAWTKPELVRRWFSPGELTVEEAELDVRVGGGYRIVMRSPEGESHSPSGLYEEIVPNERLVFSWRWAGSELVTRVTVALRAVDGGRTELTLTHEGFPDPPTRDAHEAGWVGCLEKLLPALAPAEGRQ